MAQGIRWERAGEVIEPRITAEGIHAHPFGPLPIDVRFLTFDRRTDIRMNRHDYFEVLYAYSGEAMYEVQERSLRLEQGDLFVIGSTLMHRMAAYPAGGLKAAVLYFLPDLIRGSDATGEDLEYLMPFLVQDADFPHIVRKSTGIPSQVFELARRVSVELPAGSVRARLTVKTYLKMMLVLLVNHYAEYKGSEGVFLKKQRDLDRLQPVFRLIDAGYPGLLPVERAAECVNMSKSAFMRFFRQVTGQPFIVYVNHFRVAKAQALLATTGMSMAEVSQETGFCDQSYFGLVFRKLTGETPRAYRLRMQSRQAQNKPEGPETSARLQAQSSQNSARS